MGGVKDKRKDEQKAEVVHETECKGCEKTYIGEMARNANIRAKEHCSHATNGRLDPSAVAEHVWTGQEIDWAPTVITIGERNQARKIKKSWLLQGREKAGKELMNRDRGVELSTCGIDLL